MAKKKKKPSGNPARGFATTSIASKPKPEKSLIEVETKENQVKSPQQDKTTPVVSSKSGQTDSTGNVHSAQTPEELEAQLERDELQLLVEKFAAKVRRESSRNVSKFQTDRRVVRAQSHSITIHDWFPNELLENILALAQSESNDSNRRQGQQSLLKSFSEEDFLQKLWVLDLTLRDLGFSPDNVRPVLEWMCANAASIDTSASVWGLQEAMEWLALNQCDPCSFSYGDDTFKRTAVVDQSVFPSVPGTPAPNFSATQDDGVDNSESSVKLDTLIQSNDAPLDIAEDDLQVSDLDSDMELSELVPTYLKIKSKLYEIDPTLVDPTTYVRSNNTKGKKGQPITSIVSQSSRKLLSQLRQLTSDALFDQDEANTKWPLLRNQIAQAHALKRQQNAQLIPPTGDQHFLAEVAEATVGTAVVDATAMTDSDGDDDDLLGGMFSAVPAETPRTDGPLGSSEGSAITLRDFGKLGGITPRRLLEETVRSRDAGARFACRIISPSTYACRHSLTIYWSKRPDVVYYHDIPGVTCSTRKLQVDFQATNIAAPSVEQSEGFVATAALFSLFTSSAKDEKVYLRLPSNWRDVYRNFIEHRQNQIDEGDRDSIRYYRSFIQDQVDHEESDGVVFTNRFKMRNQAATTSNASISGYNTPVKDNEISQQLWARKASTAAYQHMLVGRSNLPVYGFRASILSTIDKNQITIICGETGCGKSTQIPSYILEHELSQGKVCKVFCTEPRRISAISLAQRVSEELGEGSKDIGTVRSLVGYAIRLESKTNAQTRLVYATVGVVLRMLETSQNLQDVTHLIIDEVHERSIDTDFLLIILRSLLERRPELKVILMSATVDAARFSKYLNDAPILQVPGRTFPVQTRYLEDAIELTRYVGALEETRAEGRHSDEEGDEITTEKSGIPNKLPGYSPATRKVLSTYDEYAIDYDLIVRLIEVVAFDPNLTLFSSAVLVFLPGIGEIRQLNDILVGHPSFDANWLIYPLHSTIASEEQQAAFLIPPPGVRKIVLATNIAETGVTIPDITCVIDTGKHKEMRFDERRQLSRLTQSFISKANAKQRRGRAGRVQEGLCFHLFTKYRHDSLMADQQTPEMLRLSLQDLVMRTKICKLGDIEATLSQALDPPSSKNIRRAIDALIEVNALTSGEDLTPLGRQIAKLPLDAHLGKLIIIAASLACVDVAITIAAILSSKSPFLTPFGAKQRADSTRLAFKKGDSDLLTAYNAYTSWRTVCTTQGRSEAQFCHKNFLSPQALSNIEDLKAQLLTSLIDAGFIHTTSSERHALSRYRSTASHRHRSFVQIPPQYNTHSTNDILATSLIAAAFYPKLLTRDGKAWRNISNNQTVTLAPTSVNKHAPPSATFLSYYHILQASSKYCNAHSTSLAHPVPLILLAGAEVDFKLHAGIISLPGNTVRFAVRDWRAAVALKVLRRRVREVLSAGWKNPGRVLGEREEEWMGLLGKVFEGRWEREERVRERARKGAR